MMMPITLRDLEYLVAVADHGAGAPSRRLDKPHLGGPRMRVLCRIPRRSKLTGAPSTRISADCLWCPDSARIRRRDKNDYPKIARKFHHSPSRL